jgi:hypothetical protein
MHTVEFHAGMHLDNAAKLRVAAAAEHGEARGMFNDIELTAAAGVSPDTIVKSFHDQSEARSEAWRNSPEGKAYAAKQAAEIATAQDKHDDMVRALPNLDFKNGAAVLDWLCDIQGATDRVGVAVDKDAILATFAAHGFHPGVNCGDAFKADDRENVLRWLVGQALDGLQHVAIHGVIHKFAADWKAKFDN